MTDKKYIRDLTYSGDFYSSTPDLWKEYWKAVEIGDWEAVEYLETGENPDFYYDP